MTHGYAATTIEQIAARACASKRTIYATYSTKAALFEHVATALLEQKFQSLDRLVDHELSARQQLIVLGRAILRLALESKSIALDHIVMAESAMFPDLAARLDEIGFQRVTLLLRSLLQCANAASPAIASETLYCLLVLKPMRDRFMGVRRSGAGVAEIVDFVLRGAQIAED